MISFLFSQCTREIAIRMALGADRASIVKAVVKATMIFVTAGLATGLGLGLAAQAAEKLTLFRVAATLRRHNSNAFSTVVAG